MSEVRETFVRGRPDEAWRGQLIEDLETYLQILSGLGLALDCVWLDGSFISSKVNPSDVDITPVVDAGRSAPHPSVLPDLESYWIVPKGRWKREPVPGLGRTLSLDVYGIVKVADSHPGRATYIATRGHWDDWWQRSRATGQTLAKGFVEVVLP